MAVSLAPTVTKAFSPSVIAQSDSSVLTITLTNSQSSVATLTSPLVDQLPANLSLSNATLGGTCSGTKTGVSGGNTVTYEAGGTIPASSSCTITANVSASALGSYTNTISANTLQTDLGNAASDASAALLVSIPPQLTKSFSPTAIAPGEFGSNWSDC